MTSSAHGVGLGLAIVKSIVDRHGGAIGLESGTGKGCRFKVTLPNHVEANRQPAGSPSAQPKII